MGRGARDRRGGAAVADMPPRSVTSRDASDPPGSADAPSAAFDLVVLAGSLGGPEAIREVVAALPAHFPAAVLIVQHRTPAAQHLTVELLRRRACVPVALAAPGDSLRPGEILVLPADRQLVLGPDGALVASPSTAHGHPTADALLCSVAARVGSRALAVVVSGANADGAVGAAALRRAGGRVLAQDRATARCFAMPAAAIATGCVDLAAGRAPRPGGRQPGDVAGRGRAAARAAAGLGAAGVTPRRGARTAAAPGPPLWRRRRSVRYRTGMCISGDAARPRPP